MKTKVSFACLLPLLLLLILSTTSCTSKYVVHPGAINKIDSAGFDSLLIAQTTIDQLKENSRTTGVPSADQLNALVDVYNLTRTSWLTARGAAVNGVIPLQYVDDLQKNIAALTSAIQLLRQQGQQ